MNELQRAQDIVKLGEKYKRLEAAINAIAPPKIGSSKPSFKIRLIPGFSGAAINLLDATIEHSKEWQAIQEALGPSIMGADFLSNLWLGEIRTRLDAKLKEVTEELINLGVMDKKGEWL